VSGKIKVATFNINNVKKRLANLVDWLREERPDIVCLQELKATDSEFPIAAVEQAGRARKRLPNCAIMHLA